MKPHRVQLHDAERLGPALWSYGLGSFKVLSTNRLRQTTAHCSTIEGWVSVGADLTGPVFNEVPEEFFGENSEIVNSGVVTFEWTGTGTDEQFEADRPAVGAVNGDVIDFGGWMYLEASGPRTIDGAVLMYNSGGTFLGVAPIDSQVVQPNEWTLVQLQTTINNVNTATIIPAFEQEGGQTVGDKVHLGMAFLNVNSDNVPRPSTTMDAKFHIRAKFRQIGGTTYSGQLVSSQNDTASERWGIDATYNGTFSELTYISRVKDVSFNVPIPYELSKDRVYDLEFEHDYRTGKFTVTKYGSGGTTKIYETTLTTIPTQGYTEYNNYGLSLMPGNWGVLYELTVYDHVGTAVEVAPIKNVSIYDDQVTSIGNPVQIAQEDGSSRGPVILDRDLFERSVNSGPTLKFQVNKADHGIVLGPDLFVATSIQSRADVLGHNLVSSWTGTVGFQMETSGGTGTTQKWKARVDDGPVSKTVNSSTVINDGKEHILAYQIDSINDLVSMWTDDLETPETTSSYTGSDFDDHPVIEIGGMAGGQGATVIFDRTLTDDERDELRDWYAVGALHDAVPTFVMEDAVLYCNPNAEAQKKAIGSGGMVNLVNKKVNKLTLYWLLRSLDGTSRPSIESIHLNVPSIDGDPTSDSTIYVDGSAAVKQLGPMDWQRGVVTAAPQHAIKTDGGLTEGNYQEPFTIVMLVTKFRKEDDAQTQEDLISFGNTRFYYDHPTGSFVLRRNDTTNELTKIYSLDENITYLISLKRSSSAWLLSINGLVVIAEPANNGTTGNIDEIVYGGTTLPFNGAIHCVAEFDRQLSISEEKEIYRAVQRAVDATETAALSDAFDYVQLNWG